MTQASVLFVCTLRGGRARIAELFANELGQGAVQASSACFEPGTIRGLPVQVMDQIGLEFSADLLPSVFQEYRSGRSFDYVVAMCDESGSELCDLFRSNVETMYGKSAQLLSWDVKDFSAPEGIDRVHHQRPLDRNEGPNA